MRKLPIEARKVNQVEDNLIVSCRRPKDLLETIEIGLDWKDMCENLVNNRTYQFFYP